MTNPHSVTVAYTSSDTEKATIDASAGTITLVAAGDTTISAVFAGDDTYEAQTVTYTLTVNAEQEVLPEVGTVYDFIGYADETSSEPTSTGTVTYNGVYEGTPTSDLPSDGSYVWGTANATFVGSETPVEVPVFILTADVPNLLDGSRVEVISYSSSDPSTTTTFGYGEFTTQEP